MVSFTTLMPRMLGIGIITLAFGCVPTAAIEEGKPLTVAVQQGIAKGTKTFSHAEFDALLQKHVLPGGRVDYAGLEKDHAKLKSYNEKLGKADIASLSRDELLALFINAYNSYTLDLIVRNYPIESIKKISSPWDTPFCVVGGEKVTLNDIEHKFLRPVELFNDPRMHFAINCASIGCPPLSKRAYTGKKINAQLEAAVTSAFAEDRYFKVAGGQVAVSKILSWFKDDFVKKHGSLAKFLLRYAKGDAKKLLKEKGDGAITFQSYDWNLNDRPKPAKKEK